MIYRLGELIESFSERCGISDLSMWDISGINIDKEFFEPARQAGSDTSNYKNVPPGYFACNLMHVGRDVVLPVALNDTDKNKIVSPAYTVFRIKDNIPLINEYFFMFLKSPERDRYFWFHADSPVRDGMPWDDFCDVKIDVPPIEIQRKYAGVYTAMTEHQRNLSRGLDDLQLVCDMMLDRLKHTAPLRRIGDLLEEVDNRNTDGKYTEAHGINISKEFMPSLSSSDDLRRYKIVARNQFAYSSMQTGRDECIRIALLKDSDALIVSPAYYVLRKKVDDVLEEYLQMWFSHAETDRAGWFMSDSSIRANLDLSRFFELSIPIPDIKIQRSIANIYTAYQKRKSLA